MGKGKAPAGYGKHFHHRGESGRRHDRSGSTPEEGRPLAKAPPEADIGQGMRIGR